MQAVAAERAFETDAACRAGFALDVLTAPGACRIAPVVVAARRRSARGDYRVSLRYADGVRAELAVGAGAYRRFRVGRTAFVQFFATRVSRFGNLSYAELTAESPARRASAARTRAALGAGAALAATALAAFVVRGGRRSRANDGA